MQKPIISKNVRLSVELNDRIAKTAERFNVTQMRLIRMGVIKLMDEIDEKNELILPSK